MDIRKQIEWLRRNVWSRGNDIADTMEKLLAENAKLAESLLEALEWNWLDKDFNEVMFDTFSAQAENALDAVKTTEQGENDEEANDG